MSKNKIYSYSTSILLKLSLFLALTIPIIIFCLPMLLSGNKFPAGDFDMQVQMTEAAKISILQYQQFPGWNPWVAGGVPLFGDPQFGLITPQTILSLFVESVYAWKLTILIYLVIGFFSMVKLTNFLTGNKYIFNYLLSYIWIFGSFFSLRAFGGHFTFMVLALLPLVIYLGLSIKNKLNWLWLGLLLAYIINASLHYSTIIILIVGLGVVIFANTINVIFAHLKKNKSDLKIFLKNYIYIGLSLIVALFLNIQRIFISISYINDGAVNRVDGGYEKFIGFENGILSLMRPYQYLNIKPNELSFGNFELSNYIGIFTLLVFFFSIAIVIFIYFKNRKSIKKYYQLGYYKNFSIYLVFLITAIVTYTVGLGGIVYHLVRQFPILSSTRVSTRWFFITSFCILILISLSLSKIYKYKSTYKHLFSMYLFIGLIEVFYYSFSLNVALWINNPNLHKTTIVDRISTFNQEKLWQTQATTNYYALTQATKNNRGQAIADIALLDTRIKDTVLCDKDEANCNYILSNNAVIIKWTPNNIILQRTGKGKIIINSNSSKRWSTNGSIDKSDKFADSSKFLIINDDSVTEYELKYGLPLTPILNR